VTRPGSPIRRGALRGDARPAGSTRQNR